jgi:hypothetical protein
MYRRSAVARFEYSTLMPPGTGEARPDFFLASGFPSEPFVNRCQFLRRRLVLGAGKFSLYLEG